MILEGSEQNRQWSRSRGSVRSLRVQIQGERVEMSSRAMEGASATPVQCERAAKVTLHPRLPNKAFEKSHV